MHFFMPIFLRYMLKLKLKSILTNFEKMKRSRYQISSPELMLFHLKHNLPQLLCPGYVRMFFFNFFMVESEGSQKENRKFLTNLVISGSRNQ